ncbi:hypothetical protein EDC01DRAFT_643562 [Geopyxis carbonaria]|nr:hypothetical protein EDC01DRAFT_643562 [Geopyxis carbonaria]
MPKKISNTQRSATGNGSSHCFTFLSCIFVSFLGGHVFTEVLGVNGLLVWFMFFDFLVAPPRAWSTLVFSASFQKRCSIYYFSTPHFIFSTRYSLPINCKIGSRQRYKSTCIEYWCHTPVNAYHLRHNKYDIMLPILAVRSKRLYHKCTTNDRIRTAVHHPGFWGGLQQQEKKRLFFVKCCSTVSPANAGGYEDCSAEGWMVVKVFCVLDRTIFSKTLYQVKKIL